MKIRLIRFIITILILSIILNILGFSCVATTVRGDIDGNGMINAIDMVFIKKFLIETNKIYSYVVDVNGDDSSDIRDFIRMKKYLAGMYRETFTFEINKGFVWTTLQSNSFGVVIPVGYRVESKSWIKTDKLSRRYAYEASTFAYAIKNPNPEINLPEINVGVTTVNGLNVDMRPVQELYPPYTYVDPDWIWALGEAHFTIDAPESSSFDSLVTVMMPGAIYPLREINNTIVF